MTTEITSLPQLTAEGVPLAQARCTAEATRLARAATELEARGEAAISRALAEAAQISLNTACSWLRQRETSRREAEPMLSVVLYSSSSISDNIPGAENSAYTELPECAPTSVDPRAARPAPQDGEPLLPTLPLICPAASAPAALALERRILAMSSVQRVVPQDRRATGT